MSNAECPYAVYVIMQRETKECIQSAEFIGFAQFFPTFGHAYEFHTGGWGPGYGDAEDWDIIRFVLNESEVSTPEEESEEWDPPDERIEEDELDEEEDAARQRRR